MLRSGLALMFSHGFRPEVKEKHLTVVKFVNVELGNAFKRVVNSYDFMRRKRHRFVYEPDIPCSKKEAEDAIGAAKKFVSIISDFIKKQNPQVQFDF